MRTTGPGRTAILTDAVDPRHGTPGAPSGPTGSDERGLALNVAAGARSDAMPRRGQWSLMRSWPVGTSRREVSASRRARVLPNSTKVAALTATNVTTVMTTIRTTGIRLAYHIVKSQKFI